MEQPLVTVICACYNQSKFCIESLESVKNQTYKNLEIIIWDDASKDNSVQIIEDWIKQNSHLNIRFIKNEENQGICKSLNKAYSFATGKYLQILALDDILLSDKVERHVSILENSGEEEALVFTDAYLMDDESIAYQNKFIARYKKYLSYKSGNFFEELLIGNFIPAMSVLYKTTALEKVGLWDENLVFEDYDMMLRIAREFNFIFDENLSAKYRVHSNNTHKVLSSEITDSIFKMYLKYIGANERINSFLKYYILDKYKVNQLKGEQILYFKYIPPKNFRERWIMKNENINLYKIVDVFVRAKDFLIKKSNLNNF
ncbi:glycosyltransferase [Kaistella jeonii]|uniref:Glycosyltransferase 2-like domain-containing protein n=1 Tax=Kaistella jeonii TaxID=266749 RepID=A0A0C1CW01_9FLAO|nr:glycosyltransferase [Kaistella jeonii]KIA88526.1 hypothetical protein OA86_10895 [Kaistella jeonii]SFC20003.1 Glycosyl transferase family 2 [Kaistella jeonii]VEI97007.1 Chondroitin polymerase [Kaistella jeonii]